MTDLAAFARALRDLESAPGYSACDVARLKAAINALAGDVPCPESASAAGDRFRRRRLISQFSQEDLAAAAGVERQVIVGIEHGSEPRVGLAVLLASLLRVRVDQIWRLGEQVGDVPAPVPVGTCNCGAALFVSHICAESPLRGPGG